MIVILMGVTASGKTTTGLELVKLTGWQYAEGDDYHSEANRKKMESGTPLNDEDRAPWLATLHRVIADWYREGESGVLTCSALKQAYRDILVADLPHEAYRFVLLEVPLEELRKRILHREGHFMPPSLLESQLRTLEMPHDALRIEVTEAPDVVARRILDQIGSA
jgi:gluconokinase